MSDTRIRIAVIADTHDRLPEKLTPVLAEADEIWHLGDVSNPDVLLEIQHAAGRPVYVVRGNTDWSMEWPLHRLLERGKFRFFLIHIPPRHAPEGCDVVLHGHTHVPRDETIDGIRWLNPGCITRPNRGAPPGFAWLTIEGGRFEWELQPLPGKTR